jgi:FemAB-related protein (PEP-CTERM system-associated)
MPKARLSIVPAAETPVVVTAASEADRAAWDRYVKTHVEATQYHQWQWRGVFERAFGHETQYLTARRGATIVGVLPIVLFRSRLFGRFMVSLPFVNYGGVLADDAAAAQQLLTEAGTIAGREKLRHLELRHTTRQFAQLPNKQHKVSMLLTLAASTDSAWATMDKKVRNQIRKAEKSGLTAAAGGIELLDEFYTIFARNMRDLGTPVYARAFFEQVLTTFPDRARIMMVRQGETPVAAGIMLADGDSIEVPWASSLSEFRALCPNHTLYWSVIQWAIDRRFRVLDFGRSTPDEGTFQFKRQWGAVPMPLCWEYELYGGASLPDQSPKNPKFKAAIDAWKRCPLWLTNTLGPHIVRNIP